MLIFRIITLNACDYLIFRSRIYNNIFLFSGKYINLHRNREL